jgi:hypothetical protein
MPSVPSLSRVCRRAVAKGLPFRLSVRRSRVSLSDVVAVLSFGSFSAAKVCAASWALLLPAACGGVSCVAAGPRGRCRFLSRRLGLRHPFRTR